MEPDSTRTVDNLPAGQPDATETEFQEDVLLAAQTALLSLRMTMQTLQLDSGVATTDVLDGLHRDFNAFVEKHGDTVAANTNVMAEFAGLVAHFRQIAQASGYSLDKEV